MAQKFPFAHLHGPSPVTHVRNPFRGSSCKEAPLADGEVNGGLGALGVAELPAKLVEKGGIGRRPDCGSLVQRWVLPVLQIRIPSENYALALVARFRDEAPCNHQWAVLSEILGGLH